MIIFLSQPSLLDIQNVHWPHPTLRVQNLLLLSHQLSFISNFISNLINLKGLASFSNSLRQRMNVSEVAEYIVPDVPEFPDIGGARVYFSDLVCVLPQYHRAQVTQFANYLHTWECGARCCQHPCQYKVCQLANDGNTRWACPVTVCTALM